MNYYQEIVADFIAASRRLFIAPEYRVELGKPYNFWIDVLAIDPAHSRVHLCEVTYDKRLKKLQGESNKPGKIETFNVIHENLKKFIFEKAGLPCTWDLGIWIFVLRPCAQMAVALRDKSPILPLKISFLECTAPWSYSNGFWASAVEPGKPYPEVPEDLQ
jgi:hypothetical protein